MERVAASLVTLLIQRARWARAVAPINACARTESAALESGETPAAKARSRRRERRSTTRRVRARLRSAMMHPGLV